MSCKFGWTRSFLNDSLSNAFMNGDWLDHRQQVLWRREEAYLPEAQLVAEHITKGRNLRKELAPVDTRRNQILKELAKVEAEYNVLIRRIHRLEAGEDDTPTAQQEATKKERKEFIRHCPHDNCKGFLSSAWKCGLCENYTCKDCLIVRGKERDAAHTCNKDDLATAQLIAKDTKFCPNPQCGIGIMRTEGCSQMFCVSCKTAFDWNTMRIITSGHIHNPHYFAYLQANGGQVNRTAGDMLCGGLPPPSIIQPARGQNKQTWMDNATTIYQAIGHMFDVMGPRYLAHIREEDNRDYRVKYLLNDMSKTDIERILVIQERKRERERSIREVIDTFSNVGAEIFRRFAAESKRDAKTWDPYYKELRGLREYCNDEFMKISKHYKVVVPLIAETVTRYDPAGNTAVWNVHTENANRFIEVLDTTLSEHNAKLEYEQLVRNIKGINVDEQIKPLHALLNDDRTTSFTLADEIMKPVLACYNKNKLLLDKINPENKELRDVLQTKNDYFLLHFNQAWAYYNLAPKFNELKRATEANPPSRTQITDRLKYVLTNFHLTVIKAHSVHPLANEIIEMCKTLIVAWPPLANDAWALDAKIVTTFIYDEEIQKKNKESTIKRYNAIKSA
jgi:hypothetical protein